MKYMGVENRGYVPSDQDDATVEVDHSLRGEDTKSRKKQAEFLMYPEAFKATGEAVESSIKQLTALEDELKKSDPQAADYDVKMSQWEAVQGNLLEARRKLVDVLGMSEAPMAEEKYRVKTKEDLDFNRGVRDLVNKVDEMIQKPGWMLEQDGWHDLRNFDYANANDPEMLKKREERSGNAVKTARREKILKEVEVEKDGQVVKEMKEESQPANYYVHRSRKLEDKTGYQYLAV